MITIELMGGLGNQLFQIFVVLALSFRHDISCYFEEKPIHHGWRKKTYWSNFLYTLRDKVKPPSPVNRDHHLYITIEEPRFEYTEIPEDLIHTSAIRMFGYFQSWKYFDDQKETILKCIGLSDTQEMVERKLGISMANTVSMHFRMGDYKGLQDHHPILPIEYYKKALSELLIHTGKDDWKVIVVCETEDMEAVQLRIIELKEMFPNMEFEYLNHDLEDWEQMVAMSLCTHNIIANSSFSWFGAYFNRNTEKLVYHPNVWFGPAQGNKDIRDLCPPDWMKIMV